MVVWVECFKYFGVDDVLGGGIVGCGDDEVVGLVG